MVNFTNTALEGKLRLCDVDDKKGTDAEGRQRQHRQGRTLGHYLPGCGASSVRACNYTMATAIPKQLDTPVFPLDTANIYVLRNDRRRRLDRQPSPHPLRWRANIPPCRFRTPHYTFLKDPIEPNMLSIALR